MPRCKSLPRWAMSWSNRRSILATATPLPFLADDGPRARQKTRGDFLGPRRRRFGGLHRRSDRAAHQGFELVGRFGVAARVFHLHLAEAHELPQRVVETHDAERAA